MLQWCIVSYNDQTFSFIRSFVLHFIFFIFFYFIISLCDEKKFEMLIFISLLAALVAHFRYRHIVVIVVVIVVYIQLISPHTQHFSREYNYRRTHYNAEDVQIEYNNNEENFPFHSTERYILLGTIKEAIVNF